MTNILDKIQALMAKAERTDNEHERDAFMAKAEELMTRYAVERWQLAKSRGVDRELPTKEHFHYSQNDANLPGKKQFLMAAAMATGCQCVLDGYKSKKEQGAYFVGYADDISVARLIYTSLLVQSARACPRDIWAVKSRRTDYMPGFGVAVAQKIKDARDVQAKEPGTGLALIDRKDEVKKAVDEMFGRLRRSKAVARKYDHAAQIAGSVDGSKADVSGGRNNLGENRKAISG